uniref:Uncharacterized protein n=1 Tax=Leersia perrieri TaxID=77586 RepID=A0A0D9X232_9ORYZ
MLPSHPFWEIRECARISWKLQAVAIVNYYYIMLQMLYHIRRPSHVTDTVGRCETNDTVRDSAVMFRNCFSTSPHFFLTSLAEQYTGSHAIFHVSYCEKAYMSSIAMSTKQVLK